VKIEVKVSTNSKNSEVIKDGDSYKVKLKSKPHGNVANFELINLLSEYFKIPKTSIKILRGLKSRNKLVEILTE